MLGPLSDYSGELKAKGAAALKRGIAYAKKLVAAGKPHELMPAKLGEWFACDAQRFLSLYSPDSAEEIFSYARAEVVPTSLRRVSLPILVALAGADEYGDRPPEEIAAWFLKHLYTGEVVTIPGVTHSFNGAEKQLAREITEWIGRA